LQFFIPLAFDVPVRGFLPEYSKPFGVEKPEWCGYPMVKFEDIFRCLDRIPVDDGQMEGQIGNIVSAMHVHRVVIND